MNEKNYDTEIQRLNSESVELRRRLEQLEANDRKRDEDIRQLFVSTKGIEVMQTQIMSRFDSMETRVFAQISQMQNSFVQTQQQQAQAMQELFSQVLDKQTEDRQDEREHNKNALQQFYENNKAIIGMTIGAIITGIVTFVTTKFGGK